MSKRLTPHKAIALNEKLSHAAAAANAASIQFHALRTLLPALAERIRIAHHIVALQRQLTSIVGVQVADEFYKQTDQDAKAQVAEPNTDYIIRMLERQITLTKQATQ